MSWTLHPASGYVHSIATLWWIMLGVGTAVWLSVVAAVVVAARRPSPERDPRAAIFVAFLATCGILFFFMGYDFVLGRETPQHVHAGGLDVTVRSRQWWWEFVYYDTTPARRLAVANELHVPVGVPVNLKIESSDVIHSVWVPRLAGKQDAVPGYTGGLTFTADTAGVYAGICAEFCGAQHAKMRFTVIAHPRQAFEDWYAAQRAPAAPPPDSLAAGQAVFLSGSCATCHAIAGTPAFATRGPDLTHVGSRRDLAAGAIPNTYENLMGWIVNPQAIKPGTQMPASSLTASQLQSLVAYLRSLK